MNQKIFANALTAIKSHYLAPTGLDLFKIITGYSYTDFTAHYDNSITETIENYLAKIFLFSIKSLELKLVEGISKENYPPDSHLLSLLSSIKTINHFPEIYNIELSLDKLNQRIKTIQQWDAVKPIKAGIIIPNSLYMKTLLSENDPISTITFYILDQDSLVSIPQNIATTIFTQNKTLDNDFRLCSPIHEFTSQQLILIHIENSNYFSQSIILNFSIPDFFLHTIDRLQSQIPTPPEQLFYDSHSLLNSPQSWTNNSSIAIQLISQLFLEQSKLL